MLVFCFIEFKICPYYSILRYYAKFVRFAIVTDSVAVTASFFFYSVGPDGSGKKFICQAAVVSRRSCVKLRSMLFEMVLQ